MDHKLQIEARLQEAVRRAIEEVGLAKIRHGDFFGLNDRATELRQAA